MSIDVPGLASEIENRFEVKVQGGSRPELRLCTMCNFSLEEWANKSK